jgi:hypothetical protein
MFPLYPNGQCSRTLSDSTGWSIGNPQLDHDTPPYSESSNQQKKIRTPYHIQLSALKIFNTTAMLQICFSWHRRLPETRSSVTPSAVGTRGCLAKKPLCCSSVTCTANGWHWFWVCKGCQDMSRYPSSDNPIHTLYLKQATSFLLESGQLGS